ncbi:hypothetical protein Tco_0590557 [Tanacetum coccineum]
MEYFAETTVNAWVIPALVELLRGRLNWVEQRVVAYDMLGLAKESLLDAILFINECSQSTDLDLSSRHNKVPDYAESLVKKQMRVAWLFREAAIKHEGINCEADEGNAYRQGSGDSKWETASESDIGDDGRKETNNNDDEWNNEEGIADKNNKLSLRGVIFASFGPAPTPLNQGENRGDNASRSSSSSSSSSDSSSSDSDNDNSSEEGSPRGTLQEMIGNIDEAETKFQLGKSITSLLNLPMFIVVFSTSLCFESDEVCRRKVWRIFQERNVKELSGWFGNTSYDAPSDDNRSFLSEVVGIRSATIKQGFNNLKQAQTTSKNNTGTYRSPNLRRSLTNETNYSETLPTSRLSADVSGPWGQKVKTTQEDYTSGGASLGWSSSYSREKSHEERLLETIITSGGVRLQPTKKVKMKEVCIWSHVVSGKGFVA